MKVLFLGAGASLKAGYPSASILLDELRSQARQSHDSAVQEDWATYENFARSTTGALNRVMQNPNPEVVLSLLDLLQTARENEHQDWWSLLKLRGQPVEDETLTRIRNPPWKSEPQEFEQVELARRALLRSLDHLFWWRHVEDWREAGTSSRAYLHHEFESLQPGDVIVTTNWDSLAERVLLEKGLWTPADGYGFEVLLETIPAWNEPSRAIQDTSAITVLKLHGSFGWYVGGRDQLYLSRARFLQHLPLRQGDQEVAYKDSLEPKLPSSSDLPAVVYPTYLKRLEYRQIQRIWSRAVGAPSRADEFQAIGYSLPSSDTAIRVLLNPLRERHECGQVRIIVTNPDHEALERWRSLLGEGIAVRDRPIGED